MATTFTAPGACQHRVASVCSDCALEWYVLGLITKDELLGYLHPVEEHEPDVDERALARLAHKARRRFPVSETEAV